MNSLLGILIAALPFLPLISNAQQKPEESILLAPDDWRSERIEFPLSFAPDLPLKGYEDVRFAPGWGEPDNEEFWTYAFVWVLEEDISFEQEDLETYLEAYYDGLMKVVADLDDTGSKVSLKKITNGFEGSVTTIDGFFTKGTIHLNISVQQDTNHWLFKLSPQPIEHPVWAGLQAITIAESP